MITLITGLEVPDEDNFIWQAYNYRCVVHFREFACALHECPPKSLNPDWREHPEDRYPVCLECHDWVHNHNWKDMKIYLDYHRERNFPEAINKLRRVK